MSGSSADARGGRRSRHACLNCRRKKVKCYGEQPSCSFCARLLQKCVYPNQAWTKSPGRPLSHDPAGNIASYEGLAPAMSLVEGQLNGSNNMGGMSSSSINWQFLAASSSDVSQNSPNEDSPSNPTKGQMMYESTIFPPKKVLLSTVDSYFEYCHNQPYCFFHEETFRYQLSNNQLPQYLVLGVLAMGQLFSSEPFYTNNSHHTAEKYASEAWKEVVQQVFDSENCPTYRLVQGATILALCDFTACKHGTAWIKIGVAVSLAQALGMMTEPPTTMQYSTQEELRRTLWSVFLLDKMATCGRHRPSLFMDKTIHLQLPCSEYSFQTSIPERVITLEEVPNLSDSQMEGLKSSALAVAVVSVLSQSASYSFEHNKRTDQKPPWDYTSEHQSVLSQLARFETFLDCYGDIPSHILSRTRPSNGVSEEITESDIFSYVVYNLCYCLLQHPFLLRRRLEKCGTRAPASFLVQSLESGSYHAQEITRTLANAKHAQYKTSASFYGYSSLVAGSIHSLFQHSPDSLTRTKSLECFQGSLAHLTEKAKHFKNSDRMAKALSLFFEDSARYSSLIDPTVQNVPFGSADIERLYSLCDYGTMSMKPSADSPSPNAGNAECNESLPVAVVQGGSHAMDHEQYVGHLDGMIPQIFGPTDPSTMMDNFSFVPGESNGLDNTASDLSWRF
ncbi:hypothetical protein OPT61_g2347 [Boeremia exigua]|uniref:Uncharacterized protein n=1 Tax=Boeremia exigua TaxID=749465 RepID=A0ACC2ILS2_9PLEO|nr:hypothetical protein OPT61_g2347 [Boeremia exigua]